MERLRMNVGIAEVERRWEMWMKRCVKVLRRVLGRFLTRHCVGRRRL